MSTITNVILTTGLGEAEHGAAIGILLGWLKTEDHPPLVQVDGAISAGKAMEAEVWIGAFNGLDHEAFLAMLDGLIWLAPDEVRLFRKRQDDDAFALVSWSAR